MLSEVAVLGLNVLLQLAISRDHGNSRYLALES